MLTLYHYSFSGYSAKVRMCLAEKALAWESKIIDLSKQENLTDDFVKINPNGLVPALVHDDKVITQSNIIIEYLDDAFPKNKLMPTDAYLRSRVHSAFIKEQAVTADIMALTFRWIIEGVKKKLDDPVTALKAKYQHHPDRQRRKFFQRLDKVVDDAFLAQALNHIKSELLGVNQQLIQQSSAFLLGDRFSMMDILWTPLLQRLEFLQHAFWKDDPQWQALNAWWEKITQRSSFAQSFQSDL